MLITVLFLLIFSKRNVAGRSEPIPLYMDDLLNAGRTVYDKNSPPVQQDKDEVTKVRLAMYIEGMSSFRTQTMDFQLDVYFQQYWKDPRLSHNETRRVLIRDRAVLNKMWHPDVYFANARIAEFHKVTQPNFLVWIEPDGSILYDTRISMVVLCTLNLEKWPLDSQRCHLRILSYAYTTDQLQIEWIEDTPITRNLNIAMSDMHIVDLYPGLCDGNYSTGIWSCVTAEFFVKREITHHVMQSYVPTTLIVVISWFSFWLDVEAVPARVSLAITTLLTLSTQANAARMALPEVSYMKAIDVWMGACMMFVFGVMIEFTIVNYAQRQGRKWHRTDAELVMATSLESMTEKDKKPLNEQITYRARSILDRFRSHNRAPANEDGGHIALHETASNAYSNSYSEEDFMLSPLRKPSFRAVISDPCESPGWPDHRGDSAERLANWATFDDPTPALQRRRISALSRLLPNGQEKTNSYGSTTKPETNTNNNNNKNLLTLTNSHSNSNGKTDKWSTAIKQIQKHKKIAGRNRAKRIDQKSRWVFPLSFAIFNATYWSYYLYFKE